MPGFVLLPDDVACALPVCYTAGPPVKTLSSAFVFSLTPFTSPSHPTPQAMMSKLPRGTDVLRPMHYAVFGLGSMVYKEHFNAGAHFLDEELAQRGAQRLSPVGLGNEEDPDRSAHMLSVRPRRLLL